MPTRELRSDSSEGYISGLRRVGPSVALSPHYAGLVVTYRPLRSHFADYVQGMYGFTNLLLKTTKQSL